MKRRKNENLCFYYDQEADIFYLSNGKPSAKDQVIETGDDVLLRTSPKTGVVRGVTILNVKARTAKHRAPIQLPIEAQWFTSQQQFSRN